MWLPCRDYVPAAFTGVVRARAARKADLKLLGGLRVRIADNIVMNLADMRALVQIAGGVEDNTDSADVSVVCGRQTGRDGGAGGAGGATVRGEVCRVNESWLSDCIAQWQRLSCAGYQV